MAEKKKRKPLRDINKDGKKNFADTWLGDAIGADGKIGVQGPGLKKSLKGARRGEEPKKETKAKPKAATGSRSEAPRPPVRPRARPERGTSGMLPSAATEKAQRTLDRIETAATPTQKEETSSKSLLRAPERRRSPREETASARAKVIQRSAEEKAKPNKNKFIQEFSRTPAGIKLIQSGVTGQALRDKAMEAYNKKYGMAKGGMSKYRKGGMVDYKSTGLFYDSKSPRGYR